jgi:hypothetical protein
MGWPREELGSLLSDGRGLRDRRRSRYEGRELLRDTLILLAVLLHHASGDEVLKLLIGPKAEHLFAATGRIPGAETLVNEVKKLLELV